MSALSALSGLTATNSSAGATTTPASKSLNQSDFMKLVIAQMQNQNPMSPMQDTEFMSQLAQFSQLDGINKLNQNFSNLMMLQGLTQGTNLIGKNVVYAKDAVGNTANGAVESVRVNNGNIQLVIGGNPVDMSQIRSIAASTRARSNVVSPAQGA